MPIEAPIFFRNRNDQESASAQKNAIPTCPSPPEIANKLIALVRQKFHVRYFANIFRHGEHFARGFRHQRYCEGEFGSWTGGDRPMIYKQQDYPGRRTSQQRATQTRALCGQQGAPLSHPFGRDSLSHCGSCEPCHPVSSHRRCTIDHCPPHSCLTSSLARSSRPLKGRATVISKSEEAGIRAVRSSTSLGSGRHGFRHQVFASKHSSVCQTRPNTSNREPRLIMVL